MNVILEANPHIVAELHADLTEHSTDLGSHGISAKRVLLCAVLKYYNLSKTKQPTLHYQRLPWRQR
jgi:hypothetical protein